MSLDFVTLSGFEKIKLADGGINVELKSMEHVEMLHGWDGYDTLTVNFGEYVEGEEPETGTWIPVPLTKEQRNSLHERGIENIVDNDNIYTN